MRFTGLILLIALAAGCTAPSAAELEATAPDRARAAQLLHAFAEMVRGKDVRGLDALMAPATPANDAAVLRMAAEGASWLAFYTGYSLEPEPALERVPQRQWREGRVEVEVPASNASGDRFTDTFVLARSGGEWHLASFQLHAPLAGEILDPPKPVADQIQVQAHAIVKLLSEGKIGEAYYATGEGSRSRRPIMSWWERVSHEGADKPVSLLTDLQILRRLAVLRWPGPEEMPELSHRGPHAIVGMYELPYVYPGGTRTGTFRLEMVFYAGPTGWLFGALHLVGPPFPFSE